MGFAPESSAVDPDGQAWECDGAYVVDASVFPTASGANPMLTTLAIAQMLSTRLVAALRAEENRRMQAGMHEGFGSAAPLPGAAERGRRRAQAKGGGRRACPSPCSVTVWWMALAMAVLAIVASYAV